MNTIPTTTFDALPSPVPAYAAIVQRALRPVRATANTAFRFTALQVPVGGARLRAFQRMMRAPMQDVPLTWIHVLATPLHTAIAADPRFPVSPLGIVHVHQTVERLAPLSPSDMVDLDVTLLPSIPTDRGLEVRIETVARRRGQVVWRGETLALQRAKRSPATPRPTPKPANTFADAVPSSRRTIAVPANTGRRYSRVSLDINPIHLGALAARPFGFPRAVVHGMWTVAEAVATLAPSSDAPLRLNVAFKKPILMPATVVFEQFEDGRWQVRSADRTLVHVVGQLEPLTHAGR